MHCAPFAGILFVLLDTRFGQECLAFQVRNGEREKENNRHVRTVCVYCNELGISEAYEQENVNICIRQANEVMARR